MKNHNEFMKKVKDAASLPAQTCRALGPESEEDIAMYANHSPSNMEVAPIPVTNPATSRGDDSNDAESEQSEDHTQQGIKTGSSRGSLCGDATASHGDNLPAENKFALEKGDEHGK